MIGLEHTGNSLIVPYIILKHAIAVQEMQMILLFGTQFIAC